MKENSVVGDILNSVNSNRNIFEVTDLQILNQVYKNILCPEANIKSHARFSAAVNSYIVFVKQIKK